MKIQLIIASAAVVALLGCDSEPEIPEGMTLKNPMGTKANGEPANPPTPPATAPAGPEEAQKVIGQHMPGAKGP